MMMYIAPQNHLHLSTTSDLFKCGLFFTEIGYSDLLFIGGNLVNLLSYHRLWRNGVTSTKFWERSK